MAVQKITPFLPDPEKSQRVMKTLLTMKKLDIRALKQAYDQA